MLVGYELWESLSDALVEESLAGLGWAVYQQTIAPPILVVGWAQQLKILLLPPEIGTQIYLCMARERLHHQMS